MDPHTLIGILCGILSSPGTFRVHSEMAYRQHTESRQVYLAPIRTGCRFPSPMDQLAGPGHPEKHHMSIQLMIYLLLLILLLVQWRMQGVAETGYSTEILLPQNQNEVGNPQHHWFHPDDTWQQAQRAMS